MDSCCSANLLSLSIQEGSLEAWVVGTMGCAVLEVFMLKSSALSFESGKWFQKKSSLSFFFFFDQDQTREHATLTEL